MGADSLLLEADHSKRLRQPAEPLVHPEGLEEAQNDGDREG